VSHTDEEIDPHRHESVIALVRWFDFQHLPEGKPRLVSGMCRELMVEILDEVTDSAELTAGLRKLLEAKDCFVRAALSEIKS
jgi:hypothetical protein